ncbi:hypothetical protein [uncultured Methanobrevibacter sp.]|uniref:hypothetical protein n=1 Tax=uncultured Methanobrevibacter sp. TaxID=253161 RepID=UPI0025D7DCB4|nr:hypothetical protein [uncultured Methanobrevibacter sp.]
MSNICNARITSCSLGFFEPRGASGKNFKLLMELDLADGGLCVVDLNPIKIPMLLELLEIRDFYRIEGQFVQVKYEGNKRPNFIKNILAKKSDEWFELDNDIYFGCRITSGESNEKK